MEDKDIFTAIKNNDVAFVNKMINEDKSILNQRDYFGDLPIHVAAETSLDMVKALINLGAKVNQCGHDDQTPLFYAKNLEIAKYLVENGARIEAENYRCETPIFRHIHWNNNEIVEYLIVNGANCYKRSCVSLLIHFAIQFINNDNDYLFDLICKNCDVNVVYNSYANSATWAVSKNNLRWLKKLVNLGNDLKFVDCFKDTLLHIAAKKSVAKDMFKYLFDSGIDINAKNIEGRTALMNFAYYGNRYELKEAKEIINLFIQNGADCGLKDNKGHTAIDIAKYRMNDAIYDVLKEIDKNKNINKHIAASE